MTQSFLTRIVSVIIEEKWINKNERIVRRRL